MLMYDVSNEQSFVNVRKWVSDIREQQENLPLVIIGNKTDLRPPETTTDDDSRRLFVSTKDGSRMASECGAASFAESSVVSGDQVLQSLGSLVLLMIRHEDRLLLSHGISLSNDSKSNNFSCCSRSLR